MKELKYTKKISSIKFKVSAFLLQSQKFNIMDGSIIEVHNLKV